MPIARVVLKGTRHYCASSASRRGDLRAGARLVLIAEVGNLYDANAVEVRLALTDEKLGYLSRQIAPRYRQRVQAGSITDTKIVSAEMVRDRDGQQQMRIEISVAHQGSETDAHASGYPAPRLNADQLPNGPGVYALINDVVQRSYIGSSKNVKARVAQHFRDLASGSHANALLQKDYTMQLGEGFTATVIQRLQRPEQCEIAESRAIAASLRQKQKLYNMTEDGQGSASARFGTTIEVEASEAISDRTIRPSQRIKTGHDAAATAGASRGSSMISSKPPVALNPQPNPSIRWWWIVGGIALLIFLLRGG